MVSSSNVGISKKNIQKPKLGGTVFEKWTCKICESDYQSVKLAEKCIESHYFKCNYCSFYFKKEKQLNEHLQTHSRRIISEAQEREKYFDFDKAVELYDKVGMPDEAARVRKLKNEKGTVIVDQTVVHGDYVDDRDTIIKDSVLNRSSVGGRSSKMQELKELTEMKEKGLIDDDELKQMKKEILGK